MPRVHRSFVLIVRGVGRFRRQAAEQGASRRSRDFSPATAGSLSPAPSQSPGILPRPPSAQSPPLEEWP